MSYVCTAVCVYGNVNAAMLSVSAVCFFVQQHLFFHLFVFILFYRQPLPINLTKVELGKEIEKACDSTYLYLGLGPCRCVSMTCRCVPVCPFCSHCYLVGCASDPHVAERLKKSLHPRIEHKRTQHGQLDLSYSTFVHSFKHAVPSKLATPVCLQHNLWPMSCLP